MLKTMLRKIRTSFSLKLAAFAAAATLCAYIASAQEPLKLNTPYHCPDGTDDVIFSCNTNASGKPTCFWRKLRNGAIESENFSVRALLEPLLKVCNLPATAKPGAANPADAQQNAASGSAAAATNSAPPAPGTKQALARCIASGRSQRVCFSENLSSGFDQLSGISLKLPSTPGLRMTGDYLSATGFRIIFQPEKAVMTCRGASAPEPYTVEASDTRVLIKIQHSPKPVVLVLRPDGKLEASGPIRLTGIAAGGTTTAQTMGSTTTTTTTQRELTPLEAQNYPDAQQNGQVFNKTETSTETGYGPSGTHHVTQYTNKTVDCTLGLMNATGPTPIAADVESPMGLLTTIASGMGTLMQGGTTDQAAKKMLSTDQAPAPGLRLGGKFVGQSGFSITFHPESVSVACGDAELAHQYTIQKNATQTVLKIQDKENPITLQLKPDGSLLGEGTAQVNGRVIVGTTEDPNNPYVFAPKIARCPVGSLSPTR